MKKSDYLFCCVLSSTETSKIPGISAAGANPELVDYTPAGDAELVEWGRIVQAPVVPFTPSGCPTPALITRAALELTGVKAIFFNAGLRHLPIVPLIDLQAKPGRDIRNEIAVEDVEGIYNRAERCGRGLGKLAQNVVIGESIPGGTTTALGVLRALGYDFDVSSSFPQNPLDLKKKVVEEGLEVSGIKAGDFSKEPLRATRLMGDPMQPAVLGLAQGAKQEGAQVILAGGTQMVCVAALIKHLGVGLEGIFLATTKYIASDQSIRFGKMMEVLGCDYTATDPGFGESEIEELGRYESGEVKEGVGAGGAIYMANSLGISSDKIRARVEALYRPLRKAVLSQLRS
jgi:uncharacterized protein (TIGR00303 family)